MQLEGNYETLHVCAVCSLKFAGNTSSQPARACVRCRTPVGVSMTSIKHGCVVCQLCDPGV